MILFSGFFSLPEERRKGALFSPVVEVLLFPFFSFFYRI